MKSTKKFVITFLLSIGLLNLVGCKEKGPMEKAGESLDKAGEKVADKTKDGVEAVGDAAEKAGDKIKDAVN